MSIVEVLHMMYVFVPKEIILITLGAIAAWILLEREDRKNKN